MVVAGAVSGRRSGEEVKEYSLSYTRRIHSGNRLSNIVSRVNNTVLYNQFV